MADYRKNLGDLVYSTEPGKMCPDCRKIKSACTCKRKQTAPRGDGVVRVGRETKGRKGAGMTIISGVPLNADDLKALGKELKKKCGTGGTVKNGVIEIQGDHRDKLVEELQTHGWVVKRVGG
jgi:translation initiation factor 1